MSNIRIQSRESNRTAPRFRLLMPRFIRLEAATACQLKCPSCPTAAGETGRRLGTGFLRLGDFRRIVDDNPWVSHIELTNWGEIFLNKELLEILAYGYKRNVALYAANGVNLNTARADVLEGVVKYKLRTITCSIDGASQQTYAQYRVNGHFDTVIGHIRKINEYKRTYRSEFPRLRWQYVAFGHNEHEITKARQLAHELGMEFFLKLSWGNLYSTDSTEFSPIRDPSLIRRESGLGVASREEYRQVYGQDYATRQVCLGMWREPQINIDGRVLGCACNYWGDYGNAFRDGLQLAINTEAMDYARQMLQGRQPARPGIPCSSCKVYHRMQRFGDWIADEEVAPVYHTSRRYIMLENSWLGVRGTRHLAQCYAFVRNPASALRKTWREGAPVRQRWARLLRGVNAADLIKSSVHPVPISRPKESGIRWKPYPIVRGSTLACESFSCHSSVLEPGHCPHPPHRHRDEEILVMLSGQAELLLPELEAGAGGQRVTLKSGQLVYYPADFPHTLTAMGAEPPHYLMLKWYSAADKGTDALSYGRYDVQAGLRQTGLKEGRSTRLLFEGRTESLAKLHCHVSTLMPAGGYAPHADPYDLVLIVMEGVVETLGQRVEPAGVVFCPAGEAHGIHNPGDAPARYVVFEFHRK